MVQFDKDPFDDDVEATWMAYECGWTEYAPVDETDKVPGSCICGAELRENTE
jgi:hypothetical protein